MIRKLVKASSLAAFALLGMRLFMGPDGAHLANAQTPSPSASAGAACPLNAPFPSNIIEVDIPPGAMDLGSNAFGTNPLSVPVGTVVIWVNRDSIAHTVTSDSNVFDAGPIQPGSAFAYTFNSAGSFGYHCSIHPSMTGTVVVGGASPTPSPSPSQAPATSPTVSSGGGY